MSRIACVIGGSGFLGSHVADKLSETGYEVRILDEDSSVWRTKNQHMMVGSILDEAFLDASINGAEVVYNFAGLSDLNEGKKRPIDTIKLNILGNANVIESCIKHNVKKFIYASSVYVYSSVGGFYRCSKQASELYIEEYARVWGLNYNILRYGSLYGPRSGISNGLRKIVQGALKEKVIRYEGNPEAIREYIHVQDAANLSVEILDGGLDNQSLLLTGDQAINVSQLLAILSEMLGVRYELSINGNSSEGHYVRTPYSYIPKLGRKVISNSTVDLGQGLLQLIQDVQLELDAS